MESFLASTSSSLHPINSSIRTERDRRESVSLLQAATAANTKTRYRRPSLLLDTSHGKNNKYRQLFASFTANLGGFALGTVVSWTSPALPSIRADTSSFPEPLTEDIESWIGSLVTLGACIGGPLAGFLVEWIGRRNCMLILTFPFLLGWIGITLAQSVYWILVGRLVTGICAGAFCLAAPIFVGEIADSDWRGYLSAGYAVFACIGILFIYILGTFVGWRVQAGICAVVPVLIFVLILWIPESPRFLLSKGEREKALNALAWFKGQSKPDYATEYQLLKLEIDQRALEVGVGGGGGTNTCTPGGGTTPATEGNSMRIPRRPRRRTNSFLSVNIDPLHPEESPWKQLQNWSTLKPIFIGLFLVTFNELSGIDVITFYTVDVFKSAHVSMNSYYSTIIIGIVQLIASIVAAVISDRYGRRLLLLTGEFFVVLALGGLTTFFVLKQYAPTVATDYLQWLPLTSLIVFTFMYVVGLGTVGYMLMSEILPRSVKGFASSVIIILKWLLGFAVTKSFVPLLALCEGGGGIGQPWPIFGTYMMLSMVGFGYIYGWVPETCGKTLEEIQALFEDKEQGGLGGAVGGGGRLRQQGGDQGDESDLLIINEEVQQPMNCWRPNQQQRQRYDSTLATATPTSTTGFETDLLIIDEEINQQQSNYGTL